MHGKETVATFFLEGGFDDGADGDILGGDEEGGGWDVGDEDLVLPADLVSLMWKAQRFDLGQHFGYWTYLKLLGFTIVHQ